MPVKFRLKKWQESDLRKRAVLAQEQLERYQVTANRWPTQLAMRTDVDPPRVCNTCRACGQSLWFVYDEYGEAYDYTAEQALALITAHIRQCHATEVPGDV